jgi:putative membrane protein
MTDRKDGPVLIEIDTPAGETPASAPPVPEPDPGLPEPAAMQIAARLAARKPSRLARWFWGLAAALVGFVASVAAWDFVTGLLARNPALGFAASVLLAAFLAVLMVIALRELAAFARLRRVDALHARAEAAAARDDLEAARGVLRDLKRLYAGREELRWGLARLDDREADIFDADGLLALAEAELLAGLDATARREVEAAARQVATVTAIVPLALADLIVALTANLRMIRRIAEIYGGRAGALGAWRLTRAVLTHLVATGAVAVGDDMIGSVAGGSVLSKLSRRFGEGVINGALTARVGVAAMEVCRPLPFAALKRPSVTSLVKRALSGLFDRAAARPET